MVTRKMKCCPRKANSRNDESSKLGGKKVFRLAGKLHNRNVVILLFYALFD